jgi:SAM-dependent methyltransferase
VERWEELAATRWGQYLTAAETAAIERAHALAPAGGRALDVGCGSGRWTRLLLDLGWSVTSTDVDPHAVRTTAARNPHADCRLVAPEDTRLPVEDGTVSLIVCIEVLPVAHSDWFPAGAYRALVPGGRMVTVAWNNASLRGRATDVASRIRDRKPHPYYQASYRAWRRRVRESGFRIEAEQGLAWLPFTRGSNSRFVPWAVAAERRLGLSSLPQLSPWVLVTAARI